MSECHARMHMHICSGLVMMACFRILGDRAVRKVRVPI